MLCEQSVQFGIQNSASMPIMPVRGLQGMRITVLCTFHRRVADRRSTKHELSDQNAALGYLPEYRYWP